jgi:hypothetical protein
MSESEFEEKLEEELSRNYDAFQDRLHELLESDRGRHALMRHGDVVEIFDTSRDAFAAGNRLYDDGFFSLQEITDSAADLGFYSYAVPQR